MIFPTKKFSIQSKDAVNDPVLLSVARSGKPKTRRLYSGPRRSFNLVLRGLTDAERSTVDLFLVANRMTAFQIEWCGVPNYGGAIRYPTSTEMMKILNPNLLPLAGSFTIESNVYVEKYPAFYSAVLAQLTWNDEQTWNCEFDIGPSGELYFSRGKFTVGYSTHSGPTFLKLNRWTPIAVSYDGVAKLSRLYQNGQPDGPAYDQSPFLDPTTPPLDGWFTGGWGTYANDPNPWMQDELRIWNTVRTPAEIAANVNVALAGDEPGLIALYHFDELSGNVAHDSTANANDALLDLNFFGYVPADDVEMGQPVQWLKAGPIGYKRESIFSVIEEKGVHEWSKDDGKWATEIAVLEA